jgi:DNA polymerase III alpha subunit
MKYKPKNISELTSFIAAIRPSFQSMYPIFEKRENFIYDIKAFDDLLQTKEIKSSFLIYQEQIMETLAYAGIETAETYSIIKAIAKKKSDQVKK